MSCHVISYHIISYRIVSYRIASYHIISYHITSHHIIYLISYHIISYHIISYHIISYHIISYHIISHHIPLLITNIPLQSNMKFPFPPHFDKWSLIWKLSKLITSNLIAIFAKQALICMHCSHTNWEWIKLTRFGVAHRLCGQENDVYQINHKTIK